MYKLLEFNSGLWLFYANGKVSIFYPCKIKDYLEDKHLSVDSLSSN